MKQHLHTRTQRREDTALSERMAARIVAQQQHRQPVRGYRPRILPASWQSRALYLALSMLVMVGGSLVALGLPFLQASWWLALSLASYTLASAVWSMLLPRLRPGLNTMVCAQRHLMLGQGMGLPDSVQLAHERAQEERVTCLLATAEGILITVLAPLMGGLIDFYGSVDRVLVIVGQCFLLGLTLSALVCVLRDGKQHQPPQVARMALHRLARNSIQMRYSQPVWRIDCKK